MTTEPAPSVVDLSPSQAWALARSVPLGRLAVVVDGRPDLFPVNHVVDHGCVIFRSAPGVKLSASVGAPVAFEVDGYDLETGSAWSVVMKGVAHEIHDVDDVITALLLPLFPWYSATLAHIVRIDVDEITGRRIGVVGGARTDEPAA